MIDICTQHRDINAELDLDSMLIVSWLNKIVEGTLNKMHWANISPLGTGRQLVSE